MNVTRCDYCKNEESINEPFWVSLNMPQSADKTKHFCSLKCFWDWCENELFKQGRGTS